MKRILFFLNLIVAIFTIGGYMAGYTNPSVIPISGFLGLGLPILIALNFLFFLLWLVLAEKRLILSLAILLLGYGHLSSIVQFSGRAVRQKNTEALRVLSYNAMVFKIRDSQPLWYETSAPLQKVFDDLYPDIMVFQEYSEDANRPRFTNFKHRYVKTGRGSGLAILSKYPIINRGEITNPLKDMAYRGFLFADIVKGDDTLRIINIHLVSIALAKQDLKVFVHPKEANQEKIKSSSRRIVGRLFHAFKKRGEQVDAMLEFINQSPFKVILCGDFNDTPGSYTYRQFTRKLSDSFVQAGSGFGTTHPKFARYRAPLRIDHIMHHPAIKTAAYSVIDDVEYSDHYPVVVDLIL